MAEINLKQIIAEYQTGITVKQLASKYNLKEAELNKAIQKELCSKDKQPLPNSIELTLENGTKILASPVKTVKQPKGGTVTLYITEDGKEYYQYIDSNGKQTKVTDYWDSFSAAMDNLEVAWQKLQNKDYWSAITTLLKGAEDPAEGLGPICGEAPAVGLAKGAGIIKGVKNLWKFIKEMKNIKTFAKFKSFAVNLLRQLGIREKLNPNSFGKNIKRPSKIYTIVTEQGVRVSQSYGKSGVIYYDTKIPNGFRDGGRAASIGRDGKIADAAREIITVDRELDQYLMNAINYAKNATKNMNEEQKVKFLYNMVRDISGNAAKGLEKSQEMAKQYCNQEVLLGDVFAKGAASCRHKSLMFKILADEVGLNAKVIRGEMGIAGDMGGHAWNEIKLSNGKKFVVDTQNGALINLSSPNKEEAAYLKKYYYNERRVY